MQEGHHGKEEETFAQYWVLESKRKRKEKRSSCEGFSNWQYRSIDKKKAHYILQVKASWHLLRERGEGGRKWPIRTFLIVQATKQLDLAGEVCKKEGRKSIEKKNRKVKEERL